jgi:hypothetical protein
MIRHKVCHSPTLIGESMFSEPSRCEWIPYLRSFSRKLSGYASGPPRYPDFIGLNPLRYAILSQGK